ncbi:unannotated protein [freshwater metagenome]|uniref:Unannotated protein n=1 Tax=freshwater metagenome TaxID=449393 RepID=A0A6J7IV82_9ZZZZ|nr:hypothetical protein [Actinomycetota bacterium]MSV63715.1 hypothetical protein [Actinomycetota bacterium]MSW25752.1 hypothetical protein [Actinomycetota bacterium]MSW33484.1 hypothetical protein [Actinomycetota bacterium]MSX30508.1 hypothetical protein [Actinomycetota bacterium]
MATDSEDVFARVRRELSPVFDSSGDSHVSQVTLDEARADLARAISRITHGALSEKFGPLVGTITETTVVSVLKDLESNLYRAKGDFTLVAQELIDRAVTKRKKK